MLARSPAPLATHAGPNGRNARAYAHNVCASRINMSSPSIDAAFADSPLPDAMSPDDLDGLVERAHRQLEAFQPAHPSKEARVVERLRQ